MGICWPLSSRGISINQSDPVIRRLCFDSDPEPEPEIKTQVTPKILPPSPNKKTVRKFNKLLRDHRKPKPKPVIPSCEIINPHNLEPIHLRKDPLPPLSPRTRTFALKNGAGNIVKRRDTAIKKHIKKVHRQLRLPRKKSIFVDDSAIEDDGSGGDIKSTTTTPPEVIRIPDTPAETLILPRTQHLPPIPRITKSKPPVFCDICGQKASSEYQIKQHQKGKKCKTKAARINIANKNLFCSTCKSNFKTLHNFHGHKCRTNRKN